MVKVRQATPDDAAEMVRLRGVMFTSIAGEELAPGAWGETTVRMLRSRLAEADGSLVAFVVDSPDQPGTLAACVVGVVEDRLGSPDNPTGEAGYVVSVATDPDHRRRGYSRACMQRLLAWYRRRGITTVDLRASTEGEPLYRSLGFVRTRDPAMQLILHRDGR